MKTDRLITSLQKTCYAIYALTIVAILVVGTLGCQHDKQKTERPDNPIPSMVIATDMSNQKVTAFAEDSVGRIWIGTFRGLNRYNSYDYHQFFCTDDSIDLPDNQINHLFYDSKHRLWVATIAGVAIYDDNNHFSPVKMGSMTRMHASQVLESDDHRILVNFNDFLAEYDEDKHELQPVLHNINPRREYTLTCQFDRRNQLWIGTNTSLRCYQGENYQLVDSIPLPDYATAIYMDKSGDNILLGGNKWLAVYNARGKHFKQLKGQLLTDPRITEALITNIHPYEGYWLLNTSNHGLLVYQTTTDKLWGPGDPGYPFDLPIHRIDRLFTDSHKNLWVGSYNNGAQVINQYKRQFNSNTALQNHVNGRPVSSVDCDQQNNLWCAAAHEGLIRYNMTTGDATTIDAHTLSGNDSPNASITLVKCATDGNIWVGSLLESKVWRCRWSPSGLEIIKKYDVIAPHAITEDGNGDIWIGTGASWLLKYDKTNDTFQSWEMPDANAYACFVSGVECADDKMYVTALMRPMMQIDLNQGLSQELPLVGGSGEDTPRSQPTPNRNPADESKSSVDPLSISGWDELIKRSVFIPTDLLYDSYGLLWIGTVGNGLLCYDPRSGHIESVKGLPCTDISAIIEDMQGHIWISTQYGIARYDRTTKTVKSYYAKDGLGGNQFYDRAATCLPDGTIVFGGTHGLTVFNPVDLGVKRKVPMVFEDIKIHNQIVDPLTQPEVISKNLSELPTVNIDHDQNAFSISFAALDYSSKEPTNYYYKLEGHDPYWIDANETNEAYYSRLAPGTYIFKARIGDGSESLAGEEIAIKIKVRGNPWRSWWAICIYVTLVLTPIILLVQHKKRLSDQKVRMDQILAMLERANTGTIQRTPSQPKDQANSNGSTDSPGHPNDPDAESDTTSMSPSDESEAGTDSSALARLSESDRAFLQELQTLMETELGNSEFDINQLAKSMRISRTKLYYKIKSLTGTNPATFFKTYKLNRAAQLLKEGRYTMSEIAERTGYATLAHFSTSFKKHFGMPPTEFQSKKK